MIVCEFVIFHIIIKFTLKLVDIQAKIQGNCRI